MKAFALALTLLSLHGIESANILGFFPTDTKSHFMMYGRLMKEMAERGHQVTVVTQFPTKPSVKNWEDVILTGVALDADFKIADLAEITMFDNQREIIDLCVNTCKTVLNNTLVHDVIKRKKYDLFVTEIFGSDCFLSIPHNLGIPVVGIVSSVLLPWVNEMVGNPDNPSYIPPYFLPYNQRMTFNQRVYNTFVYLFTKMNYYLNSHLPSQNEANSIFPNTPSLLDLAKNYSLILTNSHFSVSQVRPMVSQIVEVGGLHIAKNFRSIPTEVLNFLDSSKNGVIYFSLGSIAKIETMPETMLNNVMNVFASLDYNVLWKINGSSLTNLPQNVKTIGWFPQLEVLCHPNVKLFISHGGMLSTMEAAYCGVPVLGIPIFADQGLNIATLQSKGVAEFMKFSDFSNKNFQNILRKMLNDDKYANAANFTSKVFRDRPLHPLDTAVYWLEYVLKYGSEHLKSPATELQWYQYALIDVFVFLGIIVLLVLTLLYLTARCVYERLINYGLTSKSKKSKRS